MIIPGAAFLTFRIESAVGIPQSTNVACQLASEIVLCPDAFQLVPTRPTCAQLRQIGETPHSARNARGPL